MSGAHLCFYSARCRYSQAFLEELSRTPYAKEFRFICVDAPPGGARPSLPPYVRAVPTLMIAGEHQPRVDGAVMNWITERRLRERSEATPALMGGGGARPPVGAAPVTMTAAGGAGTSSSSSSAGPPTGGGPMTDMTGERGGGGLAGFFGAGDFAVGGDEGYAFLNDPTGPSDKSMVRMAGNMAGLGDYGTLSMSDSRMAAGGVAGFVGGGAAGGAAASMADTSRMSAKERAMNDAYEAFKASRDKDVPLGPVRR
jgi:hypothetical protein